MKKFYKHIGLVKKPKRNLRSRTLGAAKNGKKSKKAPKVKKSNPFLDAGIDVLSSIKRVTLNYSENNGTFLPGYLQTPGFIGTLKPSLAYTFGSQRDIRDLAARRGWLTVFPEFNQQYTTTQTKQLDIALNLQPVRDLKIDIIANRSNFENSTENFQAIDNNADGLSDIYDPLITNTFGNFGISTLLIKTAFSQSDEAASQPFNSFRSNRLVIANRLAQNFYGNNTFGRDADGFPEGFGKTSQKVLIPSFLAAYSGQNENKVKTSAFREIPLPNWDLKYTGFMKFKWFKKRFKRFSLTHGYRSSYTINQFQTNLDFSAGNPNIAFNDANQQDALDQSNNFKSENLFSNINLSEVFSPLVRIDFEMKNSIKVLAEIQKDRTLSLSLDNNLLTEIQGYEYIFGLGYRIKDVRIKSQLAGPKKRIVSDLNMKADISIRDNKTIIRYLDLDNDQVTTGQTIWGLKYSADYAFSKNLTGIFYFDYSFAEYAISTAFPQTTIRSGVTLRYNFGN